MSEKIKKPQETIELTDATTKMLECSECEQKVQHELRGGFWYCTVCGNLYTSPLLRPVITR